MFDDTRPIYSQLADRISDDILRGRYAAGDPVPSTNVLSTHLRINPATAGKGLNLLVDRGVLEKRRGLGMFVTEGARELIIRSRTDGFVHDFIKPMLTEAAALGLSHDDLTRLIQEGTDHD